MSPLVVELLDELFEATPILVGGPAPTAEVEEAERRVGMKFDADYREFLIRYGGAMVGGSPILGLRAGEVMGDESVVDVTLRFRADAWPPTREWVVISIDGRGNPIGINARGEVWTSDHDAAFETTMVSPTFEAFVLKLLKA